MTHLLIHYVETWIADGHGVEEFDLTSNPWHQLQNPKSPLVGGGEKETSILWQRYGRNKTRKSVQFHVAYNYARLGDLE